MTAIAFTADPTSPTAKVDAVAILIENLASNDAGTYNASHYPTEDENRYFVKFTAPSSQTQYDLTSVTFSCDADGTVTLPPVIFPVAGTWRLDLWDVAANSSAANDTLVVA
jgi:hypothetical protein